MAAVQGFLVGDRSSGHYFNSLLRNADVNCAMCALLAHVLVLRLHLAGSGSQGSLLGNQLSYQYQALSVLLYLGMVILSTSFKNGYVRHFRAAAVAVLRLVPELFVLALLSLGRLLPFPFTPVAATTSALPVVFSLHFKSYMFVVPPRLQLALCTCQWLLGMAIRQRVEGLTHHVIWEACAGVIAPVLLSGAVQYAVLRNALAAHEVPLSDKTTSESSKQSPRNSKSFESDNMGSAGCWDAHDIQPVESLASAWAAVKDSQKQLAAQPPKLSLNEEKPSPIAVGHSAGAPSCAPASIAEQISPSLTASSGGSGSLATALGQANRTELDLTSVTAPRAARAAAKEGSVAPVAQSANPEVVSSRRSSRRSSTLAQDMLRFHAAGSNTLDNTAIPATSASTDLGISKETFLIDNLRCILRAQAAAGKPGHAAPVKMPQLPSMPAPPSSGEVLEMPAYLYESLCQLQSEADDDTNGVLYESVTSSKTATVKVHCAPAMHGVVARQLTRQAVDTIITALADPSRPSCSGSICITGCIQLILWMRQLDYPKHLHTSLLAALQDELGAAACGSSPCRSKDCLVCSGVSGHQDVDARMMLDAQGARQLSCDAGNAQPCRSRQCSAACGCGCYGGNATCPQSVSADGSGGDAIAAAVTRAALQSVDGLQGAVRINVRAGTAMWAVPFSAPYDKPAGLSGTVSIAKSPTLLRKSFDGIRTTVGNSTAAPQLKKSRSQLDVGQACINIPSHNDLIAPALVTAGQSSELAGVGDEALPQTAVIGAGTVMAEHGGDPGGSPCRCGEGHTPVRVQAEVVMVEPVCLTAGQPSMMTITLVVGAGTPSSARVVLLENGWQVVTDTDVALEACEGGQRCTLTFEAPGMRSGLKQLLVLVGVAELASAEYAMLVPLLCVPSSAAEELKQLFGRMVAGRMAAHAPSLPDTSVDDMDAWDEVTAPEEGPAAGLAEHHSATAGDNTEDDDAEADAAALAQRVAWGRNFQGIVGDIAFVLEGRGMVLAAMAAPAGVPPTSVEAAKDAQVQMLVARVLMFLYAQRCQSLFVWLLQTLTASTGEATERGVPAWAADEVDPHPAAQRPAQQSTARTASIEPVEVQEAIAAPTRFDWLSYASRGTWVLQFRPLLQRVLEMTRWALWLCLAANCCSYVIAWQHADVGWPSKTLPNLAAVVLLVLLRDGSSLHWPAHTGKRTWAWPQRLRLPNLRLLGSGN